MYLFKSEMLHEVPAQAPRSYGAPAFGRRYGRRGVTTALPETKLERVLAFRAAPACNVVRDGIAGTIDFDRAA
ncbi:hypothetical protein [Lysobacter fragariae]